MSLDKEKIKSQVESALGSRPYILRTDPLRQALDGLNAGVMSNFDSTGKGPSEKIYVGRKTAYPTEAYITWLVSRISDTRPAER